MNHMNHMNLENYRTEIDGIDDEILRLFKRRMDIAGDIAKYKTENNLPVYNPQREKEILHRICSSCDKDMQSYAEILFGALFDISRAYQNTFAAGTDSD